MMLALALFACAQIQAPSAPPAAPPAPAPAPKQVEPWTAGFGAGLREMQRLSGERKTDEALDIGERLLAPTKFARWREEQLAQSGWRAKLVGWSEPVLAGFGVETIAPIDRALVQYTRGVVLEQSEKHAEQRAETEAAFGRAVGEGERAVQLDALYDIGVSAFGEGEEWRAKLPEKGAPPTPPAAPQAIAGGNGPTAPPPPDPLARARAAYQRARGSLVQHLRADWKDADTRAMTELVQRRLRELDEIEKKRKEQQQDDKQKQKDKQDQKDKKDGEGQPQDKDKQDDKDKQPPKDQDKNKDPQGDKDPQDKQDKQDPAKDQKKPDEKQPEPKPGDKDKQDKQDAKQDTAQAQGEERELSQEEMTRLFDKLKQLEEQARKLREQFRRSHRQPVKKDW